MRMKLDDSCGAGGDLDGAATAAGLNERRK